MLLSTCRSPRLFALPLAGLALAAVLVLMAGGAQATLIDRGDGFIYDTVQNITWTQNANINGSHDWQTQMDWAAGYSQTHSVYGTFDDWRLPTTLQPDASCNSQTPHSGFPLQSSGSGCTGSEMGHLSNVDGIRDNSVGLFANIQGDVGYWSATLYAIDTDWAWFHTFGVYGAGQFQFAMPTVNPSPAWAVFDGDVVPEPSTGLLLTLGLAGLGMRRRGR